jgi:hypothetical protein
MSRLRVSLAMASGRSHATANFARSFVEPTTPLDGRSMSVVSNSYRRGVKDSLLEPAICRVLAQDRFDGEVDAVVRVDPLGPNGHDGVVFLEPESAAVREQVGERRPARTKVAASKRCNSQSFSTAEGQGQRPSSRSTPTDGLRRGRRPRRCVARARLQASRAPPRARRATRQRGSFVLTALDDTEAPIESRR